MREQIAHKGRVLSVTPETTIVSIVSRAACAECHASSLCGLSELKEKKIEVQTPPSATYREGDEVEVVLKGSMGLKAVWIAYVIPLIVLLVVALGLSALGAGELVCGASAVVAVAAYYFVIWLLRDRLENEYVFTIKQ